MIKNELKEETESYEMQKMEMEIGRLQSCLGDKDKRITKLEDRWFRIFGLSYLTMAAGSIILFFHTCAFIASDGVWGIGEVASNYFSVNMQPFPNALTFPATVVLCIVLVILLVLLVIGLLFLFFAWIDAND
jgi:hypothetical protein